MFLLLFSALVWAEEPKVKKPKTEQPRSEKKDGAIYIHLGGKVVTEKAVEKKHFQSKEQKISVDLQQADIQSVVRFFSRVSGRNIIVTDNVQGKITMRVQDVYWHEAFAAVLWAQGLAAVPVGEITVVQKIK